MKSMPADLDLTPLTRRPCRLAEATLRWVEECAPQDLSWGETRLNQAPRASIVIVTHNNLPFTKLCLASIAEHTGRRDYEVIIVDNASTDGTRAFLEQLVTLGAPIRRVLNAQNESFARANNQGLGEARGDVLVLLNNDTIVTPGWLDRLIAHAENDDVGLIGPVTNRIGNEAEVETSYRTLGEMLNFAERLTNERSAETFDIPTLCMFCLAMRRDVWERLGPIDERFEVGMLEDDDYSARARQAGLRLACAEDVFIHHFGQASFGNLWATGEYQSLLDQNCQRFIEKWGHAPAPYGRRRGEVYGGLVERVRHTVERVTPPDAIVLAVSKGDEELLKFDRRIGWHFPRAADGGFAGFHPPDSETAIAQLELHRLQGASFVVFPQTTMWWLAHYAGLAAHLQQRGREIYRDDDCVIFALSDSATATGAGA
jgi:GT2 family glycosyltransferase